MYFATPQSFSGPSFRRELAPMVDIELAYRSWKPSFQRDTLRAEMVATRNAVIATK